MAKLPRILIPFMPHHVTQRGNRRMQTFFDDDDYVFYLRMLNESCCGFNVTVHAYCLMPNHVHLILTPTTEEGIRQTVIETHSAYSRRLNQKKGWKGYLWQGRFFSCPMDERYFQFARHYVEQNPVRAKMCYRAEDYRWSSADQRKRENYRTPVKLFEHSAFSVASCLSPLSDSEISEFRHNSKTGRPIGSEDFLRTLEIQTGRIFLKQKPGPKKPHI